MTITAIERSISGDEYIELMCLCGENTMCKKRFVVYAKDEEVSTIMKKFEIDILDDGLIMAKMEVKPENEEFPKPSWLGKELTNDESYYSAGAMGSPWR